MIAALLSGALLASSQAEPSRLRTILSGGGVIFAEAMPKAKRYSIHLAATSASYRETAATHGRRHLLEHLMLKRTREGKPLHEWAESRGIFFTATTYRDAMIVSVVCVPSAWKQAAEVVKEVLQPLTLTSEQIRAEATTMAEERALYPDSWWLSQAAWTAAFGVEGVDSSGDKEIIAATTSDQLSEARVKTFARNRLALTIVGPPVEDATAVGKDVLVTAPPTVTETSPNRQPGKGSRLETNQGYGEARGALVGGIQDRETIRTLAAAYALAGAIPGAFITYTPTGENGLILLGRTTSNSGVGLTLDAMTDGDMAALLETGRALAKGWILQKMRDPVAAGEFRAELLMARLDLKPDTILESLDSMNWVEFLNACKKFRKENCVIAVGVRS